MLDRYGVDALRLELSRQLTEVIKQELPAMKATLLKERKLVSLFRCRGTVTKTQACT